MNNVNKTLYIPLYGKSYVSRRGLFLSDKKAEQIWAAEGFTLRGKSKSRWLACYMGIRAAVFDEWTQEQLKAMPQATVIHIGCGLDSRCLRVSANTWYDVDFPAVIRERKRYYREAPGYHMIGADVRQGGWLGEIPEGECAVVVMEGVSMYLRGEELQSLTAELCAHFEKAVLLMDVYTPLAARLSGYKNPVRDVGVTEVFGLDDPRQLERGALVYVKEHTMTPRKYVDTLRGAERFIFRRLYAGKLSGKLYRLLEYRKDRP